MLEFLKRLYYEAYDLPAFYIGIDEGWKSHLFTIFFILALFLSFAYIIRLMIGSKKERKARREMKRKMERSLLDVFEEHNKNKKNL